MKSKKNEILNNTSLEYVNGQFQGYLQSFSIEKTGIFYWDSGFFYVGEWKKNKINGKGIFIYPNGSYLYSTFSNDHLNGLTILRLISGHIMIGNWHLNKKKGLFLYYDNEENLWLLCQHNEFDSKPTSKSQLIYEEYVKEKENLPIFLENFPALKKILNENLFQLLNEDFKEKDSNLNYTQSQNNIEYHIYIIFDLNLF